MKKPEKFYLVITNKWNDVILLDRKINYCKNIHKLVWKFKCNNIQKS